MKHPVRYKSLVTRFYFVEFCRVMNETQDTYYSVIKGAYIWRNLCYYLAKSARLYKGGLLTQNLSLRLSANFVLAATNPFVLRSRRVQGACKCPL